ncbi:MAG: TolC family protein [Clostridia bacterium]|nr:TolC family protein [Clostridia bacterium]
MRRMRKGKRKAAGIGVGLLLLAMLFSPASSPVAAGDSNSLRISLEEAVAMALANQLNLGAAEAVVIGAEASLKKAEAARWPGLTLSASGTRISPEPPSLPFGAGIPNPSYSAGLTLSWPLYTGGKVSSGIKMARLGLEAARADYEKERETVIAAAVNGYVNLLKAGGLLEISRRQVELVKEHLTMVELKMALGAATKTDLLETRVRLSQAEQGLARTEHGRALAEIYLKNLLGLTGDEELILAELPGVEKDFPLPSLAEATGTALEYRKELAGLRYYLAIAEENLRMAKGFWKPTIALVGRYTEEQKESPRFSDPTFYLTLGLEASLFSGGGKLAEIKEKEAALEKGEYNYRQAVEGIKLEVKQKHLAVTEKLYGWELAVLTLKQAEENYEFTRARYELGAAQNLEVLMAQNTLYQCRFEELSAGYDYFLAVMELYQAMGKMERFLEEVKPDA